MKRYSVLAGLLISICLAGAGAMVGGLLGRFDWRLDLLAHLSFYTLILLALADGGLFVLGFRKWAALFLPFVLINAASVGPFLLPRWPGECGQTLHILLFNVNQGNRRYAEVRAFIERQAPDLLVLQEIDPEWARNLAPLAIHFPYRTEYPRGDYNGLAVYSKYPTAREQLLELDATDSPVLQLGLTWRARQITLFVVHPPPPLDAIHTRRRDNMLAGLAEYIVARGGDKILLADLNTTPWSWAYREFEARTGLMNCGWGHGMNATWPTTSRFVRIPLDHCLHSAALHAEYVGVGPDLGSDHFPLEVRVGF